MTKVTQCAASALARLGITQESECEGLKVISLGGPVEVVKIGVELFSL